MFHRFTSIDGFGSSPFLNRIKIADFLWQFVYSRPPFFKLYKNAQRDGSVFLLGS